MRHIALWLIRLYQRLLSPYIPSGCRYDPTCSHYTYQAIEKHGFLKGIWLGVQRVARCHGLSPGGYDPVPEPRRLQEEQR